MREPLTIAVAQPLCVSFDVAVNAVSHAAMVRAAGTRVVVFPELSLTGYELDAPAITAADPHLAPLVTACAETGTLALAGAPVPGEAGRAHIGMIAIDGRGARVVYQKLWLGETTEVDAPLSIMATAFTGGGMTRPIPSMCRIMAGDTPMLQFIAAPK